MFKLFSGVVIVILGVLVAISSYYYAWVTGTPNFSAELYERYQTYSLILGISSIFIIFFGIYTFVKSIRMMNRVMLLLFISTLLSYSSVLAQSNKYALIIAISKTRQWSINI